MLFEELLSHSLDISYYSGNSTWFTMDFHRNILQINVESHKDQY